MNTKRAQREILNSLIAGKRVISCDVSDNRVLVSADGFVGYVFPKNKLFVDVSGTMKSQNSLIDETAIKEENIFTLTSIVKIVDRTVSARRLVKGDEETWVNTKLLKNFDDAKSVFYQSNKKSPIIVTEDSAIVGMIMPMFIQ